MGVAVCCGDPRYRPVMRIDESAPAVARDAIDVEATPEAVWEVLTDIARWPTWNPDIKSASIGGPIAPETTFQWKAGPGTITSTFEVVKAPHLLVWSGRTLGIYAIHVYRLERQGESTLVTSEESWTGVPVRLFPGPMRKMLLKAIEAGLRHLKTEVEQQPRFGDRSLPE